MDEVSHEIKHTFFLFLCFSRKQNTKIIYKKLKYN